VNGNLVIPEIHTCDQSPGSNRSSFAEKISLDEAEGAQTLNDVAQVCKFVFYIKNKLIFGRIKI